MCKSEHTHFLTWACDLGLQVRLSGLECSLLPADVRWSRVSNLVIINNYIIEDKISDALLLWRTRYASCSVSARLVKMLEGANRRVVLSWSNFGPDGIDRLQESFSKAAVLQPASVLSDALFPEL